LQRLARRQGARRGTGGGGVALWRIAAWGVARLNTVAFVLELKQQTSLPPSSSSSSSSSSQTLKKCIKRCNKSDAVAGTLWQEVTVLGLGLGQLCSCCNVDLMNISQNVAGQRLLAANVPMSSL